MDNTKLDRYLRSVGKRTFVNCFYLFKNNFTNLNEFELGTLIPNEDPLALSNDPQNSLRRKASYAIGIFRNGRELDALRLCVQAQKVDDEIRSKAIKILDEHSINNYKDDYQTKIEKVISFNKTNKTTLKKPRTETVAYRYMRDPIIAAWAKQQANYSCEYDITHCTFISKITGYNYVEAHHLIPMRFQDKFEKSLDIPENILILCPNCHRKLHHADFKSIQEVLKNFYYARYKALENNGIFVTLEEVIKMYK